MKQLVGAMAKDSQNEIASHFRRSKLSSTLEITSVNEVNQAMISQNGYTRPGQSRLRTGKSVDVTAYPVMQSAHRGSAISAALVKFPEFPLPSPSLDKTEWSDALIAFQQEKFFQERRWQAAFFRERLTLRTGIAVWLYRNVT